MTIESKYNEFRSRAIAARNIANGEGGDRGALNQVMVEADRIASIDWPRVRGLIAESGEQMPEGPLEFDTYGYSYTILFEKAVCTNRFATTHESGYIGEAVDSLRLGFEQRAIAAEQSFERYRLAVAQGVAVDLEDGGWESTYLDPSDGPSQRD